MTLLEAKCAPGVLEQAQDGYFLIRVPIIRYFEDVCESINDTLAAIPKVLKAYDLAEYDCESLQRDILQSGFSAIWCAVRDATLEGLERSRLFPSVRKELAEKNADSIPRAQELRKELDSIVDGVLGKIKGLDMPLDLADLVFTSGSLSVPAKYVKAIAPRYTLPVSDVERETVNKMREAARLIGELKAQGIRVEDELRIPPAGGHPILAPGLITRIASGTDYTDDELIGVCKGMELTR